MRRRVLERLSPLVPGAQGVISDTALRGIHHQTLLRKLGLLPVNRVTAKKKGSKKPRRAEGRRIEKSVHVEDKKVRLGPSRLTRAASSTTEADSAYVYWNRLRMPPGWKGARELLPRGPNPIHPLCCKTMICRGVLDTRSPRRGARA